MIEPTALYSALIYHRRSIFVDSDVSRPPQRGSGHPWEQIVSRVSNDLVSGAAIAIDGKAGCRYKGCL